MPVSVTCVRCGKVNVCMNNDVSLVCKRPCIANRNPGAKTVQTIYKYKLDITDRQIIETPRLWQWLDVQSQDGWLTAWAVVDRANPCEFWEIRVIGTGHPFALTSELNHIGTAQTGQFVWHVFAKRA